MDYIFKLIAGVIAATVALTFHEFAHAFVAYRAGDGTPKWSGRLTLNPLKHFDILGIISFSLLGFGWGKPVPIRAENFRHYRRGLVLTSLAGVAVNYILAFLFYPLFCVTVFYLKIPYLSDFLFYLTNYLFAYNICFCVFNLLPLYPLDGFHVIEACVKRQGAAFERYRKYSYYVLLFLIAESFICNIFTEYLGVGVIGVQGYRVMNDMNILRWIMQFTTNYVGYPITAFWGLIPW